MRVGHYTLTVSPGKEDEDGYVALQNNTKYSLQLHNNSPDRCNVYVSIDGEPVGSWRIPAFRSIKLERPVYDTGHFTFYEVNSQEGKTIGLNSVNRDDRGLIRAKFVPELQVERSTFRMGLAKSLEYKEGRTRGAGSDSYSLQSYSAGGTGLSGESDQRFVNAERMSEDLSKAVTISIRLVALKDEPRPLKQKGNRIPPPV